MGDAARTTTPTSLIVLVAIAIALSAPPLVAPLIAPLHGLGAGVSECFDRVAIGRRLNTSDVSRTVSGVRTAAQCELRCERDADTCAGYSFGIASRGNGTCELASALPKTPPVEDTDFDLYLRSSRCTNRTAPSQDEERAGTFDDGKACFRRFAAGRRLGDRFVRRTIASQSLRHCHELCATEDSFLCEGFNFRFDGSGEGRSSCQLTSVPSEHLDPTLDFNADRDYDYFERDRNAPASCSPPWSGLRPWTAYSPHSPHPHQPQHPPHQLPFAGGLGWRHGVGAYSMRRPPGDECFVRTRAGFRLDRGVVVEVVAAPTLWHCESECANHTRFTCNVFSFRYSAGPSWPGPNCELGERSYRSLDSYTDLVPDRAYDVYERNPVGRPACLPSPTAIRASECFERIRSGLRLRGAVTRLALSVPDLHECQRACVLTTAFACRSFSFRYGGGPVIGRPAENCRLTDWPVTEMAPHGQLADEPGCELFHRASYGHGCELDRWASPPPPPPASATLYPPTAAANSGFYGVQQTNSLRYGGGSWIGSYAYSAPSAYGDTSGFSTAGLDEFCYVNYKSGARLLPRVVNNALTVASEAECRALCTNARMRSVFRCASLSYRGANCELSAVELRDLRPGADFSPDPFTRLLSWDFADARCYVPPAGSPPSPADNRIASGPTPTGETWQRFGVSGRPCRSGTVCSVNLEVGIWTCPLEGAAGDWDYCCRSGHHCGYSEGYNYPWCYVGSGDRDQWRPCSDHYYPYPDDRPMHWPVAYLHREGPPSGGGTPASVPPHQPSLVDSFLQSLTDRHRPLTNNSLPEFQVVEVKTESGQGQDNAMTKMWTWGQSKFNSTNVTSSSVEVSGSITSTGRPNSTNSTI